MRNISLEDLEKVLIHRNIIPSPVIEQAGELNRNRSFVIDQVFYTIEWWVNVCYLYSNGLKVVFYDVEQSGTWPNTYKTNLQFKDEHGSTMAIIGIEKYNEERE